MPDNFEDPIAGEARDRRTNWPLWLLVPLAIFGMVALTQLGDRPIGDFAGQVPADTRVFYRGLALSNVGSSAVHYPDNQMRQVGASDAGIVLYRHTTQPWAGGGGGPSMTNPYFMKTGNNTYLPLRPVPPEPSEQYLPVP